MSIHAITANRDFFHSHFIEDQPTDEWFTKKDLCQTYGLTKAGANSRLEGLTTQGKLEMKQFNVDVNGVRRCVNHYRVVSGVTN